MNATRRIAAVIALAVGRISAVAACSYPQPPSFDELLGSAESIALVFVESVEARDKQPRNLLHFAGLRAQVRVVETLQGEPAAVELVEYIDGRCGGLHMDPGKYYVLVLQHNDPAVSFAAGEPAILKLFEHLSLFVEGSPASEHPSPLLRELRNYARLGRFLPEFPVDRYISYEDPWLPNVP